MTHHHISILLILTVIGCGSPKTDKQPNIIYNGSSGVDSDVIEMGPKSKFEAVQFMPDGKIRIIGDTTKVIIMMWKYYLKEKRRADSLQNLSNPHTNLKYIKHEI